MKAPALVAVDQDPEKFASLFEAARERGVRIGWLDLTSDVAPPLELSAATGAGAAKAVSARAGCTQVVKPTKGAPVLRDLLREHFLGCAIVFVRGHSGRPRLALEGHGARLELSAERSRHLPFDELLTELLRPKHRA